MQVNFPKTVSGSLCSISLVVQTNYCISCLDGELHAGGAVIVSRLDVLPNSLKGH